MALVVWSLVSFIGLMPAFCDPATRDYTSHIPLFYLLNCKNLHYDAFLKLLQVVVAAISILHCRLRLLCIFWRYSPSRITDAGRRSVVDEASRWHGSLANISGLCRSPTRATPEDTQEQPANRWRSKRFALQHLQSDVHDTDLTAFNIITCSTCRNVGMALKTLKIINNGTDRHSVYTTCCSWFIITVSLWSYTDTTTSCLRIKSLRDSKWR